MRKNADSDKPIILNAYPRPSSCGTRLFQTRRPKSDGKSLNISNGKRKEESGLLKSIRAAFQGSGREPGPKFHSIVQPAVDGQDGEEELTWNETTVAWSIGGVLHNTWNFAEEGQRVQCACFGWLLTEGTVHSSNHTGGSAARYTSSSDNDDGSFSVASSSQSSTGSTPGEKKSDSETFSPFFLARKERMRTIEPTLMTRGIYIFLRNFGKIYLMNGLEYSFSLPFIVQQAWPLSPHGVLLQRVVEPSELDEEDPPLPSLYTITNPFQEPRPVGLTEKIRGGHGFGFASPKVAAHEFDGRVPRNIPAEEKVIWIAPRYQDSSDSDNIIVTLDEQKRRIFFWRYVYVPPKRASLASMNSTQPPPQRLGVSLMSDKSKSASQKMRPVTTQGTKNTVDMIARGDRIRPPSPEFEPTKAKEFPGMPALSEVPGMQPSITSAATLASYASAGSGAGSSLSANMTRKARKSELVSPMGRMKLDRRSLEAQANAAPPAMAHSLVPIFWAECIFEHELSQQDCDAWKDMTFAIYDSRFDGRHPRSRLVFCLPSSQQLIELEVAASPEDDTLNMTLIGTRPSVRSVASVLASRPNTWDLLILSSDYILSIRAYEGMEFPIEVNFDSVEMGISFGGDLMSDEDVVHIRPTVVALRNPLVSTVTLVLSDERTVRLSVDLTTTDLVTNIIQILPTYCNQEDLYSILKSFLRKWHYLKKTSNPSAQFDCFAEALLRHWGIEWISTEKPRPRASGKRSSAWEKLLSSSSHFRLQDDTALLEFVPPSIPPSNLNFSRELSRSARASLHALLNGLHILGEEMRLLKHKHEQLLRLSTLTLRLAQLIRPTFSDLLKRLYPTASSEWLTGVEFKSRQDMVVPLDVLAALYARLSQPESRSALLENAAGREPFTYAFGRRETHPVLRELTYLFTTFSDYNEPDGRKRAESTVLMMTTNHFGPDYLNLLPLSLSAPLREAARTCQIGPPSNWPTHAYEFVGRSDLTESGKVKGDLVFNDGYRSAKEHLSEPNRKTFSTLFDDVQKAVKPGEMKVSGVELEIKEFTDVRFGEDQRIREVARMLDSSTISSIRLVDRHDLNEYELAKENQTQVLRTAERTLSLPIGRAMFTFATVPSVTREVYTMPKIELLVHLEPQGIQLAPEPGKIPPEALSWAEFHNGVAAALRISPSTGAIDSSWISFNRPNDLTAEHAGFLFGLGLTGHLKEMLTWHTFGYLTPKHELTSIGVLLGLAAANAGSGNKHVTKLLAVHTPALLPSPEVDLNVPLTTQAAGLMGIGILYMGTKNRRMAEVALHQISRSDLLQPDLSNEHRETYTVSAALSFGMIMLGKGGSVSTSPADFAFLSRLKVLIHGEGPFVIQEKRSKNAFDVNMTSPAATLALGLMYLKTGRQDVADILTIPDSIAALNHIQPNFLLVRTIARNLIMWGKIEATQQWLLNQVPQSILYVMETRRPFERVDDSIELAYYHITAGSAFALALKYAGTASEEAVKIIGDLYEYFRRALVPSNLAFDHRIKRAATRDSLSLVTLAMAIVMVGTGDITLLKRLRMAHGMSNPPNRYGAHMANHMALGLLFLGEGRFSLGNADASIACMLAAFYPHFPALSSDNRSFLPALRHLWVLAVEPRCIISRDVDSKEVVYLPMKIKIREENGATGVAHLVAPTLIPPVDRLQSIKIDTPRYWPFLLDVVNNPQHLSGLLHSQTLFVKRRTMFLSYNEDPRGSRSLFVRSGMATGDAATLDFPQLTDTTSHPASDVQHYINSHSNDITFTAFADRFCRADGVTEEEKVCNAFCHAALLDCIIQDKPHMLSSYLSLHRARIMNQKSRYFQLIQQDLVHLDDFYSKLFDRRFSGKAEGINRPALLRENAVSGALLTVDRKLRSAMQKPDAKKALRAYIYNTLTKIPGSHSRSGPSVGYPLKTISDPDVSRELAWYLQRHAVPYAPYFPALRELAVESLSKYGVRLPPDGIAGTDRMPELEQGIKLILHASITGLVRPFGSWSMESLDDVLHIWQSGPN